MKNFVDTRRKEVLLFVGEMEWAELKCNGKRENFGRLLFRKELKSYQKMSLALLI